MGNSQVRSSLIGSSRNTASPQAQSRIWAQLFGPRWLFLLSLFPSKGSDEVSPAPQHVSCPSSRRSTPEALLSPAGEEEGLEGFSVLRVSNFFFQPRVHLHLHAACCSRYPGPRVPVDHVSHQQFCFLGYHLPDALAERASVPVRPPRASGKEMGCTLCHNQLLNHSVGDAGDFPRASCMLKWHSWKSWSQTGATQGHAHPLKELLLVKRCRFPSASGQSSGRVFLRHGLSFPPRCTLATSQPERARPHSWNAATAALPLRGFGSWRSPATDAWHVALDVRVDVHAAFPWGAAALEGSAPLNELWQDLQGKAAGLGSLQPLRVLLLENLPYPQCGEVDGDRGLSVASTGRLSNMSARLVYDRMVVPIPSISTRSWLRVRFFSWL